MTLSFDGEYGDIVIGVDEAGRGPWVGPVVAASVVISPDSLGSSVICKINDSKKLTVKKREFLFGKITASCKYGVSIIGNDEIDATNILIATKKAMANSVADLLYKYDAIIPDMILIDGNQLPENLPHNATSVIKGDSKYFSIAAASIVAKVTRDNIMAQLHNEYPYYGWDSNAGYGTKKHMAGLAEYGITKYHRKTYAPIKKML